MPAPHHSEHITENNILSASLSAVIAYLEFCQETYLVLKFKQVCVQPPTSADNVALLALAAAYHAAAWLLLSAGHAAINQYFLPAGPTAANPTQGRAVAE